MNKILRSVLIIGGLAALTVTGALPQSTTLPNTYTLPGIEAPSLNVVISNVSMSTATVRITFYFFDGRVKQEMRFTVPAGTQRIITDSEASLGGFSGTA